jgi:hypothetical protein
MAGRCFESAAAVCVCLAVSACSMLSPSQLAFQKATAQGSLIVPAGSASSACAPRPVATGQGTLFVDDAVRKKVGDGITGDTLAASGPTTDASSRALPRDSSARADSDITAKVVQSANAALNVLSSPTHKKLLALMMLATSPSVSRDVNPALSPGTAGVPTLNVDRNEWMDYANAVTAVSMTDGWTALSISTEKQLSTAPDEPTRSALTGLQRESSFISAYLAAYFRQGKFVSVTLKPAQLEANLQTKVDSWLRDTAGSGATTNPDPGNLLDTVTSDVLPSQCKASGSPPKLPDSCTLLGSIGQTGFVTRSGDKYAFPALTFQFDPLGQQKLTKPQVDVKNVIGDLVRVVLEATGDALYQVPAAQGSTACTTGLLPCYDPSKAPVSADNFTKVNQYAAASETVASGGVGLLIRGGFWVALNNENLATAVETGVGVTARKTAERVAWDYLSCTNAPGDFRAVAISGGGYRTLNVTLQ